MIFFAPEQPGILRETLLFLWVPINQNPHSRKEKKKNATSPVTASTNALCSMLLMLTDSSCWRQDGELIAKLKASENSALMTYSAFASLLFYCGNSCASVDFNSCGGNIMSVKQMHCFIKQNKFNSCLLGEGNMDPHCALVEQKRCIVEPLWESRKWRNQ